MKKNITGISILILTLLTWRATAQLYWDIDGATPGAGGATPAGTWDTSTTNWSADSTGASATGLWADGNTAVFAAGTDATGTYTVTVSGTQAPAGLTFEEGAVTLSGGTIDFPSGGTIQVDATLATINSVISGGAGKITQQGSGTLVLAGNNTFATNYTVAQGTLRMGASGNILPSAEVWISAFQTLDLNNLSVGVGSLGGGNLFLGTVNLGSGTLTNLGVGADSAFQGAIIGTGGLTKTGPNTLTLNNGAATTTFSGKTTIIGGTLALRQPGDLGADPVSYVADQITLDSGGKLKLNHTIASIAVNRGIYVGAGGGTLEIQPGQSPSVSCNITGPGNLTKTQAGGTGSGNVDLNGTNTFSGNLIITGGGVRFNSDIAAGTGTIIVSPVATVFLRNFAPPGNASTVTNAVVLNANGGFDIDMTAALADTITWSGPISGVGYVTRGRGTGSGGNVILSGDNSAWSGGMVYMRGKVTLGHKNALGTAATLITPATPTLNNDVILQASTPLTGANAVATPVNIDITNAAAHFAIGGVNALELSGPINLGPTITPAINVTNTGGTIFSGVVSGGAGVGLTKSGVDTLTLNGANTYSGVTTINAGTLLVNSVGGSGTGSVVVNSSGTLGGSGTIYGAVTVNSGGSVGAGSSAGSLTLTNGLNLSGGGTNVWELAADSTSNPGTDFDQIVLTGGNLALSGSSLLVKFTGTATFPDATNAFWLANRSWKIISLTGGASNTGSSNFAAIDGTNGITVGTFSTSVDGSGSILLNFTSSSLPQPTITSVVVSGGNLILQGTNGLAGGSYSILTTTNVALPLASWTTNLTGNFSGTGTFSNGVPFNASEPQRYYLIKQP